MGLVSRYCSFWGRAGDDLNTFFEISRGIPGWRQDDAAKELARASHGLPGDPIIVEIGAFLGRSTILLAGARKLKGSGKVHVVDPFDCSGDAFSVPHYLQILDSLGGGTLKHHFEANIRLAELEEWVELHEAHAHDAAVGWHVPIDLLLLDGDSSPSGAREAYRDWSRFLKPDGVLAVSNSADREYADGHDGNRRVVEQEVVRPAYRDIHCIGAVTLARKTAARLSAN